MTDELTIRQAAEKLGISPDAVRRRVKSGKLQGHTVPTPQGHEWRVVLGGDSHQVTAPPMQERQAVSASHQADDRSHGYDLANIIDRLHRENLELAGRCGYLQARVQQLEGEVKALTAPDPPAESSSRNENPPWWRRLLGLQPATT